jgi:hypothetical protein
LVSVSAVKGTFQLPGADPVLVLLGSSDPAVVQHLDESLIAAADTVDIRSGVVWMEVGNGRAFLGELVDRFSNGSSPPPGVSV